MRPPWPCERERAAERARRGEGALERSLAIARSRRDVAHALPRSRRRGAHKKRSHRRTRHLHSRLSFTAVGVLRRVLQNRLKQAGRVKSHSAPPAGRARSRGASLGVELRSARNPVRGERRPCARACPGSGRSYARACTGQGPSTGGFTCPGTYAPRAGRVWGELRRRAYALAGRIRPRPRWRLAHGMPGLLCASVCVCVCVCSDCTDQQAQTLEPHHILVASSRASLRA